VECYKLRMAETVSVCPFEKFNDGAKANAISELIQASSSQEQALYERFGDRMAKRRAKITH
jgi:hypothetical protein